MSTTDTASGDLEIIKHDYMILGRMFKALVAQVVVSVLLVRGKVLSSRQILHVGNWLCDLCQQWGFYDHETLSEDQQLLGRDGIHLKNEAEVSLSTGCH